MIWVHQNFELSREDSMSLWYTIIVAIDTLLDVITDQPQFKTNSGVHGFKVVQNSIFVIIGYIIWSNAKAVWSNEH